jgi:putative transposase
MARQLRIEYEGAFYHVTSRGNQRDQIFWDDNDREEFKKIIKRTKERYAYLLHSYVLMDNHYHLLIETPHANREVGRVFGITAKAVTNAVRNI